MVDPLPGDRRRALPRGAEAVWAVLSLVAEPCPGSLQGDGSVGPPAYRRRSRLPAVLVYEV